MSIHVYYWPDGTWYYGHELSGAGHRSDDYSYVVLPDDVPEEMIDEIVINRVKGDATNEL